jgi:putative ATP-binding cassette transporter
MNIFDSQFWNQFLAIAKPYWYPSEEGGRKFSELLWSWSMLALLLLLLLCFISINAFNSYVNRDLFDVLEQKDAPRFFALLFLYAGTFAFLTPLLVFSEELRKKLALDWYQWLTNYTLDKYFHEQTYYQINFQSEIENPDQRISQEIEPISNITLDFFFIFIEKTTVIIAFIAILWSISKLIVLVIRDTLIMLRQIGLKILVVS